MVIARVATAVLGRFIRLPALLFVGVGGVCLVVAWQAGPQARLDAARFTHFTQQASGTIVESWVALDVAVADIKQPAYWRASAKATPCVVVEFDGDWGAPARRAYCGSRLGFSDSYTLADLREIAPRVPFAWARDAAGFVVPEIRLSREAHEWLATHAHDSFMHRNWPVKTALDEMRVAYEEPVDMAIAGWVAATPTMPLAFDPQHPRDALPAAYVADRLVWHPATLALAGIAALLGLVAWFAGMMVLLGDGIAVTGRIILAVLPLLALPWWGDEFPRAMRRLDPDIGSVIADMVGDIDRADRVVATEPEAAAFAGGDRLVWHAGQGAYAETFGRLRFALPAAQPATADAALLALTDSVTLQVRALNDESRTALFTRLREDKLRDLRAAGIVFVRAAKEAALDARNDAVMRRAAVRFLSEWVTQPIEEPYPRQLGYRARVELFRELAAMPVPEVAIMATSVVERAAKASP